MADGDTQNLPREEAHGEHMSEVSGANTNRGHCCACWRYTDDMRREGDLAHEAVVLLVNATPALEQTEAFKAADAYLASYLRRKTPLAAPNFG